MLAGLGGVAALGGAELELMGVHRENECQHYPMTGGAATRQLKPWREGMPGWVGRADL